MATMLETPSRIWRRIEAVQDKEMPSLPSLPGFDDDSLDEGPTPSRVIDDESDNFEDSLGDISSPIQSTPATSNRTQTTAMHAPLSAASTARFAHSLASRSSRSSIGPTTKTQKDSFDITEIPSLSAIPREYSSFRSHFEERKSKTEEPGIYLPPRDDEVAGDNEYSISDALQSVSRSSTPPLPIASKNNPPKTKYDYSISLKSEPKGSPFDKYRNVALRKTLTRARTPSLSRTASSSQSTSPSASTPKSHNSLNFARSDAGSPISAAGVPIPRSRTNSPALTRESPRSREEEIADTDQSRESNDSGAGSMDITDIHISPQRVDANTDDEGVHHDQEYQDSAQEQDAESNPQYDEPTFSSEGDHPSHAFSNRTIMPLSMPSPNNAASSAGQSFAMTPTPAFPRPRARFDLPNPPTNLLQTPAPRPANVNDDDDLVTPHTRRKSFLLSVINSSARPRMKLGTPHPRQFVPETPSIAESPGPNVESTPSSSSGSSAPPISRVPFLGATPRPRLPANRRMSHPLAQAVSASPSTSDAESLAGSRSGPRPSPAMKPWSTPIQGSPYDGAADKASFISTASSHDLTTHHRVNTSFDPAMGFGAAAQGHGVGRFNAGKLNNYLHGLNRRLQEENETLLARVRRLEEDKKADPGETGSNTSRRSSGVHRRMSAGGALDNVQEEVAEGWLEEKAQLEEMIDAFKEEAEAYMAEREDMERELEKEKDGRKRDKERWEERMAEAEEGVANIITELGKKTDAAQLKAQKAEEGAAQLQKELERELDEVREELDLANERASKAEQLLGNGKDLGSALNEANDRIGQVMGDLRNANTQIKDLEEEVIRADNRIDELEKDLQEDKDVIARLEEDLDARTDALDKERDRVSELEVKMTNLEEEMESAKEYINELEDGATVAVEQLERLEKEVEEGRATIEAMHLAEEQTARTIQDLERDVQRGRDLVSQTQEALDEANKKLEDDDEHISELQSKVAALERERDKLYKMVDAAEQNEPSFKPAQFGPTEEEMENLEHELDDANKEIGRLNAMLNQSPARKAMDKVKDARIEMLEQERDELLERNKALRMTYEATTPRKLSNNSMISPIHRHVLSMSIRAPRTPGAPLRDLSWLNNTTNDPTVSPLIAEIHRLQQELDVANESIDDKLDKLEDAGLGVVGLTEKLEDARSKISRLEDEIARLSRKDERFSRRLARTRCRKCNVKFDIQHLTADDSHSFDASDDGLLSEPPTPPTRTTEVLRGQLQTANASLEKLRREMEDLQANNKRLNVKIKETKEESKKAMESNRTKSNVETVSIALCSASCTLADEHAGVVGA
ncbi:hypothetical protein DFP72DRAFT_629781 [Ephemerocybe angulata]|uniref:Uncharacterized protein n=1 Tax=Ephemerocybe angulata TaxID=980116 RepID=A0A8H6IA58_9AGAR|nr:hypothetical protein DFP72DRAFT_629781 [Tulosesus angulatus]